MDLPSFTYHPDPLATGSIVPSKNKCRSCGKNNGFIYAGPVYAVDELDNSICPWCIADGSAAKKFDAVYVDPDGIGGGEIDLPETVIEEVSRRTPGFAGWQQERWPGCCNDAAVFLGPMGHFELVKLGTEAAEAVRAESGFEGAEWENYFRSLNRDNGPTAYLFRCRRCNKLLAYSDYC